MKSSIGLKGAVSFLLATSLFCACAALEAAEPDVSTPESAASSTATPKPPTPPIPNLLTPQKHSVIDDDPRLKRTVSLALKDVTVSDLLAKLTELTAVKLTVSSAIADRKLTVIGRGTPVVTVMAQVGFLFDWGWLRQTDKEEITYKLQQMPGALRRAQQLRDNIINRSINQEAEAEWQRLQPILDAWVTSGGDIDSVRDLDPSMAQNIENDPQLEYKLTSLAAMPPGARYAWIAQQIQAASQLQGPDVSYGLVKQYTAANPNSGSGSDPALSRKVNLKLTSGTDFSAALEAFAKVARLSIVEDSYDRKTTLRTTEWKDAAISDILDSICNDAGYDWAKSGTVIRCRNRTWFLDELRAVPDSVAKQYKALKQSQGRLYFDDYVGLVSSLTDDQLSGLVESGDKYQLSVEAAVAVQYLPYFRFFGQLTSDQRSAVWSPIGLTMAGMTANQQAMFLQLMSMTRPLNPPYWAPGVVFYARLRGSLGYDVMISFGVEGRISETVLVLPRPQAAPPSPPAPTSETTPPPATEGTTTPPAPSGS